VTHPPAAGPDEDQQLVLRFSGDISIKARGTRQHFLRRLCRTQSRAKQALPRPAAPRA